MSEDNKVDCYNGGEIDLYYTGAVFSADYFKDVSKNSSETEEPKSVKLINFDIDKGEFTIRLEFSNRFYEIPVSMSRIVEWKKEIERQNSAREKEEEEEEEE